MARAKRIKTKESVIAKYDRKVRKIVNANWDKTMQELWDALDPIRKQMAEELKEFGIYEKKDTELKVENYKVE